MKLNKTMIMFVEEYLNFKRKLGYDLDNEGKELFRFARFADKIKHTGPLTADLALKWAMNTKKKAPVYWVNRLSMVRRFAQYRYLYDPATEIPPKSLIRPMRYYRSSPYIYSDKEVSALFNAANKFNIPRNGITAKTYQTILGLLVCTGMRISEALKLTIDDIDLQNGILRINKTKFHKSRLLPIHSSTLKRLKQYKQYRKKYDFIPGTKKFFLTKHGIPIKYDHFRKAFSFLKNKIGLTGNGLKKRPTIHSIRHTFAVKTLLRWYKEEKDIEQKIIYLSTYLGHVGITATYWYLSDTPELLAVASHRFENFIQKGDSHESKK